MDRLSPLSATFLEAEDVDPHASLAIGSFAIFEGPPPTYDEFVHHLEGRLPLLPRYRQKLHRVPFDLSAPAWVDDAHFDLRWHVRHTAVRAPGGPDEIAWLLSRVMERRMDRRRPMWEYWLCEGLAEGRWGILSKLHHSVVDGVSGTDLYQVVLDPTPQPRPGVHDSWHPEAAPSTLRMVVSGAADLATSPARLVGAAVRTASSPVALARATWDSVRGLATLAGAAAPVTPTSLTGPLRGSRCYRSIEVALDDVKAVGHAQGVTVNDVALTLVTGGLRALLLDRGDPVDRHAVRTLVPVSTRAPGQESILDNRVSLMLPYLPVDLEEPLQRLRAVHERIVALRRHHEPEAGGLLTGLAARSAFLPVIASVGLGLRVPQRWVATVTTNVPGPPVPLYALGRKAVAMLPYVPIADRVRIGVAIFSYAGRLNFGLTGDHEEADGLAVLAAGIEKELAALLAANPATVPAPRSTTKPAAVRASGTG